MQGPLPDKRRFAYRDDLAARSLEGIVDAARFVDGERRTFIRSSVALRDRPVARLGFSTEALFGEEARVYDEADGWAWVQLTRDGYVGYAPAETLAPVAFETTHRVSALGTFIYPAADIKSSPLMHLSLNSCVAVEQYGERFVKLATGGYVIARHLRERGRAERDFVDIAERLIGTPYLWGGRTRVGLDCSGLVQLALEAAGIPAPRDSDMQEAELGQPVLWTDELDTLQRGDLVFWRGHAGVMSDGLMMVHANAFHMATVAEPLIEAAHRIAKAGSRITAIKRLALATRAVADAPAAAE